MNSVVLYIYIFFCNLNPTPKGLPSAKPRHKWVDNINMDFRGIGLGVIDWIVISVRRAIVNTAMNPQVP
jgi:hypothetical protein